MDRLGVDVPAKGRRDGGTAGSRQEMPVPRAGAVRRDTTRELLEMTLEVAVPLRIVELRHATGRERTRLAEEASAHIAEHGDVILFRSPRRGETAAAVGWLITGLACAAYQPGGVRFMNLGWCAAHPGRRWAAEERVCARCVEAEQASGPGTRPAGEKQA
jgi:hypothetical protein